MTEKVVEEKPIEQEVLEKSKPKLSYKEKRYVRIRKRLFNTIRYYKKRNTSK